MCLIPLIEQVPEKAVVEAGRRIGAGVFAVRAFQFKKIHEYPNFRKRKFRFPIALLRRTCYIIYELTFDIQKQQTQRQHKS